MRSRSRHIVPGMISLLWALAFFASPSWAQEERIWHIKAIHPAGRLLEVRALDQEGKAHDVKAIATPGKRHIIDNKSGNPTCRAARPWTRGARF